MKILAIFLVVISVVNAVPFLDRLKEPYANGKTWVVLCASADTWINYGMQADVYHAYQLVRQHGIPDENIIVMHSDDIVNDKQNPTPGIVVNRPDGPDVYKGVPKHYTGKDVTPKNFLGVLNGDLDLESQGKKVVKSGPNDRIFVYLDDHGADKIVAFPSGLGVLHAQDLIDTFKTMHTNNKYAKLVFYLAACEAGSMFDKLLPNDINVYAVSATLPNELGWKAWWEPNKYQTFLAVWFAVTWLNNTEHNDLNKELLVQQYEYIKEHNNFTMLGSNHTQHAQQYGDLSIANKQHVGQYMGDKKVAQVNQDIPDIAQYGGASIRDAPVYALEQRLAHSNGQAQKQKLVNELAELLAGRELLDKQMVEYVNSLKQQLPTIDAEIVLNNKLDINEGYDCYRQLVDAFSSNCYHIGKNTYALNKMNILGNICQQLGHSSDTDIAVNQLIQYCSENVETRNARII